MPTSLSCATEIRRAMNMINNRIRRARERQAAQDVAVEEFRKHQLRTKQQLFTYDEAVVRTPDEAVAAASSSCLSSPAGSLSKTHRLQLWTDLFMSERYLQTCPSCRRRGVNLFFAALLLLPAAGVHLFVCQGCRVQLISEKTVPVMVEVSCSTIREERLLLWLVYFQLRTTVLCPLCLRYELDVWSSAWHAAHDVAASSGGDRDLHNLLPVCASCNLAMGTSSFAEFRASLPRRGASLPEPDVHAGKFLLELLQTQ